MAIVDKRNPEKKQVQKEEQKPAVNPFIITAEEQEAYQDLFVEIELLHSEKGFDYITAKEWDFAALKKLSDKNFRKFWMYLIWADSNKKGRAKGNLAHTAAGLLVNSAVSNPSNKATEKEAKARRLKELKEEMKKLLEDD